jgi:hypothetical protein
VYGENGELVVELYGINLLPWEDPNEKMCGVHCCSCAFTRARYVWHPLDFEFKLKGKPEVIYFDPDYPS